MLDAKPSRQRGGCQFPCNYSAGSDVVLTLSLCQQKSAGLAHGEKPEGGTRFVPAEEKSQDLLRKTMAVDRVGLASERNEMFDPGRTGFCYRGWFIRENFARRHVT